MIPFLLLVADVNNVLSVPWWLYVLAFVVQVGRWADVA